MAHVFWAVDCKAEGCDTQIFLKYIGPHDPLNMPFLVDMQPNPIIIPCPECGGSYEYTDTEVTARISDNPPPDDFVDQF
jgi:hypothetical protein